MGDQLNVMMDEKGFPVQLKHRLRQFFNVSKNMLKEDKYAHLVSRMSPQLEAEVSVTKTAWLYEVSYLKDVSQQFVIELCRLFGNGLYVPQESITLHRDGSLACVLRGICSRQGDVKTPGTAWGEDFILKSNYLRDNRTCLALTYVELLVLNRGAFVQLLEEFPEEQKHVRKHAVWMAFQKAMFNIAKAVRLHNDAKA